MSKGTKNYFRHSFFAHEDEKLIGLRKQFGKEAVYHYWVLVELCARQYVDEERLNCVFEFHVNMVCEKLSVKPQQLPGHLLAVGQWMLGQWLVKGYLVHIEYDKIAKYIGSYYSYQPQLNKTKLNKIKEKKEYKESSVETSPMPKNSFHLIIKLWNELSGNLAKVKEQSDKRKKKCDALWKKYPDEAYWGNVIKRIVASDFCNGKNDRGWQASIDFLLVSDTHIKTMEGKYDNKEDYVHRKWIESLNQKKVNDEHTTNLQQAPGVDECLW